MYRDWRGVLYPDGLPQRAWLPHYAESFPTVELNNSFYRLPERDQFARWAAETPDDFEFSVKVSRYLTHIRRLRDPAEPISRFIDHAEGLGAKLGPSLVQLPPNLQVDLDRLDDLLHRWPSRHPLAFEPRHPSWFCAQVRARLEHANVALCLTDRRGHRPEPRWATADWGYVRLHEGRAHPAPAYGRDALRSWRRRITALWPTGATVYVYFNNDHGGAAVVNARTMQRAASAARA
jgi:uncharacterized protein YecE (DUF72 family)